MTKDKEKDNDKETPKGKENHKVKDIQKEKESHKEKEDHKEKDPNPNEKEKEKEKEIHNEDNQNEKDMGKTKVFQVKAGVNRTIVTNLQGFKMPGWMTKNKNFMYSDKFVQELVKKEEGAKGNDPDIASHKRRKHCLKVHIKLSEKVQMEALKADEKFAKMVIKSNEGSSKGEPTEKTNLSDQKKGKKDPSKKKNKGKNNKEKECEKEKNKT